MKKFIKWGTLGFVGLVIVVAIAALIGAHLYLVAKLGTTAPPWLKAEKAKELSEEEV